MLQTAGLGGGAGGGGSSGGSSGGAPVTGGGSSGRVSSNNGGYIEPLEPIQHSSTPIIDDIANNIFLDFTQTKLLEDALDELIDLCSDEYIYNELVAQGKKFNFTMDSSLGGLAGYDPSSKTFKFRNNDAITSGKLKEEFFHAFQDAFYSGGISQYANTGKANVEFEAKLYQDIVKSNCCLAFDQSIVPYNLILNYMDWVNLIRSNPSNLSSKDYKYWVNLFNQYSTSYSSTLSSNLQYPNALISVLSNSGCF